MSFDDKYAGLTFREPDREMKVYAFSKTITCGDPVGVHDTCIAVRPPTVVRYYGVIGNAPGFSHFGYMLSLSKNPSISDVQRYDIMARTLDIQPNNAAELSAVLYAQRIPFRIISHT